MRTIDADALTASLKESADRCRDWIQECINIKDDVTQRVAEQSLLTFTECYLRIEKMPTIEPQKKHGKWIERESGTEDKENGFETVIVCSCCDFPATTFYSEDCESRTQIRTDFCPNCGADMRGTE